MSKTNTIAACYILKFSNLIENDCNFCKKYMRNTMPF